MRAFKDRVFVWTVWLMFIFGSVLWFWVGMQIGEWLVKKNLVKQDKPKREIVLANPRLVVKPAPVKVAVVIVDKPKVDRSSRGKGVSRGSGDVRILRMEATAYCLKGITKSGIRVRDGVVATDPDTIPLGSRLVIDGKEYLAADTGRDIVGNRIDIWMKSYADAIRFGRRTVTVHIYNN